ncbi:MAG TPA: M1 family metallopeptidase [Solirubrobacter sp.]|nr:M1 family metallopeptidase [Solirubrobacter sp.]
MRRGLMMVVAAAAGGWALAGFSARGTPDDVPHAASAALAPPTACVNGSADLGDTYYPGIGNGGYDVTHYDLKLGYNPTTHHLDGKATITAAATQNLCRFNLDLRGLTVTAVTVNGAPATYVRDGRELIITPAAPLVAATGFTVVVDYNGEPGPAPRDPDNFIDGWNYTENGSYTSTPPQGADTWYPCNNNTNDKATFTFTVTVPADRQVMSNGQLISNTVDDAAGTSTWVWEETEPMATYLATVNIGKFTILRDTTASGIPVINGVRPDQLTDTARTRLAGIGDIIDFFGTRFGPYPFSSVGAIVDVTNAGYQMETQTRPEFTSANGLSALAHELAHQWFGDHVAVRRMRDVWLSEGFATFANWLWSEHNGGTTAQQSFNTNYARAATTTFWNNTVFDPGVTNQYQNATVYTRGGMTLQALRAKIGDETFFQTLKDYVATFGGGTASTDDFIAIAQRDSGQDLRDFFKQWLYTPGKPSESYCYCVAPTDTTSTVGGSVAATLGLVLGEAPAFAPFTPGVDRDYTTSTTATVTSTAENAALTVSDPGHLANGAYALPSPLEVAFSTSAWTGPVSNDAVTVTFKQHIGASDALRTGTYSRTLTFTLSTTQP